MMKISILCLSAALLSIASVSIQAKPVTERELKAALTIMARHGSESLKTANRKPPRRQDIQRTRLAKTDSPRGGGFTRSLTQSQISLKRLEHVLGEVAVVFPYLEIEESLRTLEQEGLSAEEKTAASSLRDNAREVALKHYADERDPESALKQTSALLLRYSKEIDRFILDQLVPMPGK